jgi:DNA-binding winged helix-turn-helix (wHTH) protein/tetratricopeptide (TPR) repeat protein
VFELNLDTEELRKEGLPLKLGPQPFRVLAILASRSGEIVARDEIREKIWGNDTYVDFEHGLNQCIKQIRTALNENTGRPLYVETIPRKGYRFLAPVTSKTIAVTPKVTPSSSGVQPRVELPPVTEQAPGAPLPQNSMAAAAASESRALLAESSVASQAAEERAPSLAPAGIHPEMATKSRRTLIGALAVVTLAAIAVGFYLHSQKAHALMERDTVVVGDFTNTTGDPVFDGTLRQALSIQLEQSPFLNLVGDQKLSSTLRLMGRPVDSRLTPEVTRDLCVRVGSKAMFNGAIAQLGTEYVIAVKAVNCDSGDVLAEAQEQTKNKEDVLKALDRAASRVRRKVGESLRSVESFATPIEEATTPSLDALKAYSMGWMMTLSKGDSASLPYYKKAVQIDANFAMAYRYMASAYMNLGQVELAAQNARKAYDLREKVSERERGLIEGHYYLAVTGELEKAAQAYEVLTQNYPRDEVPRNALVYIFSILGDYKKAAGEGEELLSLDSNSGASYGNLGMDYLDLNRLEEAEAMYKKAEERKLEAEQMLENRYEIAFLKGDSNKMAQLIAAGVGNPGMESVMLFAQSRTESWQGRLHRARALMQQAIESALRNEAKETAAGYHAFSALRDVELGLPQPARAEVHAALELAPNRDVRSMAALALARAGDTSGADKLAADLAQEYPVDTLVQRYWLPTIKAAMALNRNDPNLAVELLQATLPVELATPTGMDVFLCPPYVRGQAYLALRQGGAAASEFQKLVDNRGVVSNFPWGVLARLGLARAYALDAPVDSKAREKARAAYQEFLTLWKDADADIPVLQQAKAEYLRLP